MKMKKISMLLLAASMTAISFTSCDKDIVTGDTIIICPYQYPTYIVPGSTVDKDGNYAITFSGYSKSSTRAAATTVSGTGYDDLALWCWNSDETVMDKFHVQYTTGWTYAGVDNQDIKYFKNQYDSHEFIGIIPQDAQTSFNNGVVTVSDVTAFSQDNPWESPSGALVGTNSADTPNEFLYCYENVAKSSYATGATLNFKHGNYKVYLKFTSDDANTEILDYSYVPANPGSPAVPGTETYTSQTVKFIDELVAGHEVQVGIGFVGASSPKLTKGNPTTLYVGTNNTSNGYLAKDWLLSIKDAVNSQFVYYRLNQVSSSTSKTETTENWGSAASNKNIFMMKLADGINATDFANGNDAFATALKAHQADWVGGTPAASFWEMFEYAYSQGWRVIRINESDTNANQVLVFLSNNQNITTQICEVTGGSPEIPATPESGLRGIRMLPATSVAGDGSDAVLASYPLTADATVSASGLSFTQKTTSSLVQWTIPTGKVSSTPVASPSVFYGIPANTTGIGYTVKVSYEYKGTKYYDSRVWIPASECQFQAGKYYTFVINIAGANGNTTPDDSEKDDPTVAPTNEIRLISVTITDYENGGTQTHTIN